MNSTYCIPALIYWLLVTLFLINIVYILHSIIKNKKAEKEFNRKRQNRTENARIQRRLP